MNAWHSQQKTPAEVEVLPNSLHFILTQSWVFCPFLFNVTETSKVHFQGLIFPLEFLFTLAIIVKAIILYLSSI